MRRSSQALYVIHLVVLIATWLTLTASAGYAQATATVYFDQTLAPHGAWVEDTRYGRVWRPHQRPVHWRPYLYGRWVYTTEYGWVWLSEEPFGWVVYHYGNWAWSTRFGWVWMPGEIWGPAWVEWCHGGGYVGWSPMLPDPYWQADYYYGPLSAPLPRTTRGL